jgi:hypothetical protein
MDASRQLVQRSTKARPHSLSMQLRQTTTPLPMSVCCGCCCYAGGYAALTDVGAATTGSADDGDAGDEGAESTVQAQRGPGLQWS